MSVAFHKEKLPDGTAVLVSSLKFPKASTTKHPDYGISKFRRMREKYLQEKLPGVMEIMYMTGELEESLYQTDIAAQKMYERILPDYLEANGVTEELKAKDQLRWVGLYNLAKKQAEEVVANELIFV